MNTIVVAILSVFAFYTVLSWLVLGPLESISETYYKWMEQKNFGAAFSIFAGVIALLVILLVHSGNFKDLTNILFVASATFMWALSVASLYREYDAMHYIPTILCILCGFGAVWAEFGFHRPLFVSLGAFAISAVLLKVIGTPYYTLWVELAAVICIFFYFL